MQSKVLRIFLAFIALIFLVVLAWTWLALHWSYSEGDRAGYVQKFSKKGWLCKTWEGEIAMVTMPGAIPEKFAFSVREDAMAEKINTLAGQRVVLRYQQHKFLPSTCFGETEYFVVDAWAMQDKEVYPPAPAVQPGTLPVPR